MKKWKRTFSLALLSTALMAIAPAGVQADYNNNSCNPCDNSCECGEWFIGADFLYWKPCFGEDVYAADRVNEDTRVVKFKTVSHGWESGVRLYVGKTNLFCGWDVSAAWTYLDAKDTSTVKHAGNVLNVQTHPAFWFTTSNSPADIGKGKSSVLYNEGEILFSINNSNNPCHKVYHSFGLAGLCLERDVRSTIIKLSSNPELNQNWQTRFKSDFSGIGLRAGTAFESKCSECFTIFANGNVSLLAGDADADTYFDASDFDTQAGDANDHRFKQDDSCRVVPGYHIAAGFKWESNAYNCDYAIRLGYEFLAWHNLAEKRDFAPGLANASGGFSTSPGNNKVALSSPVNRTLGFHGLFVGVEAGF